MTTTKKAPTRSSFLNAFAKDHVPDCTQDYILRWAYDYLSPYFAEQAVDAAFKADELAGQARDDLRNERALCDKLASALKLYEDACSINECEEYKRDDYGLRSALAEYEAHALARKGSL